MKSFAIGTGLTALAVLAVYWEVTSWGECLDSHSWWYCLRLLG